MDESGGAADRPLFDLMIRACRSHRRILEKRLADLGIHGGQHHMLMYLAFRGGAALQSELTRGMDVSAATTANMLKRLEAGGYISRSAQKGDTRRNEVTLTDRGRCVVAESRRLFDETDKAMFSGIDGNTLSVMKSGLEQVNQNLRRLEDGLNGE